MLMLCCCQAIKIQLLTNFTLWNKCEMCVMIVLSELRSHSGKSGEPVRAHGGFSTNASG